MKTDSKHKGPWADLAKDIATELRRKWGLGWQALGPDLRQALAAERVLVVVCSWRTAKGEAAELAKDAGELRPEVMKLVNPAGWTE